MSAKSARCRARARAAIFGAAALTSCFFATGSNACEIAVEEPPAVVIDYNPFAVGRSTGPLNLNLVNRSEDACRLRMRIVDDVGETLSELAVGGVVVLFVPRESSGLVQRDVDAGVFRLEVAPGASVRAELDAAVMHNAVVDAGEHGADFYLLIENEDGQPLLPRVPARMVLRSTPRAQINIAGGAGAFGSGSTVEVIDFGVAETGATRRAFLQVRANTEATLTVKSEHHGVLRRVEDRDDAVVVLPYAMELDGLAVNLADAWTHKVDPPRTLDGISLPMDFTLGVISGQMSGQYEDLITIDVTPR